MSSSNRSAVVTNYSAVFYIHASQLIKTEPADLLALSGQLIRDGVSVNIPPRKSPNGDRYGLIVTIERYYPLEVAVLMHEIALLLFSHVRPIAGQQDKFIELCLLDNDGRSAWAQEHPQYGEQAVRWVGVLPDWLRLALLEQAFEASRT